MPFTTSRLTELGIPALAAAHSRQLHSAFPKVTVLGKVTVTLRWYVLRPATFLYQSVDVVSHPFP